MVHGELAQSSQSRAEAGEHQLQSCQALPTDQSSPGNRFIAFHREGQCGRRSRLLVQRRGARGGEWGEAEGSVASFAAHGVPVLDALTWQEVFQVTVYREFRFKHRQNVCIYLPLHHNLNISLRHSSGPTKRDRENWLWGFYFLFVWGWWWQTQEHTWHLDLCIGNYFIIFKSK